MKEGFPKKAFKVEEDHNRYKCPLKGCNKGNQRVSFDSYYTCLSAVEIIFQRIFCAVNLSCEILK